MFIVNNLKIPTGTYISDDYLTMKHIGYSYQYEKAANINKRYFIYLFLINTIIKIYLYDEW